MKKLKLTTPAKIALLFMLAALICFKSGKAQLTLSIDTIHVDAVQGVYIAPYNTSFFITEKSGNNVAWKCIFPSWVYGLDSDAGTTPCKRVFNPWATHFVNHAPGIFYEKLIFYQPGTTDTIKLPVKLNILANSTKVNFSYISGPNFCKSEALAQGAIPLPDSSICTVPDEFPSVGFTIPPIGGSYVDPNFGAKVTVMSDSNFTNNYSSSSALSPHNKYLFVQDGLGRFIDTKTNAVLLDRGPYQALRWDAYNDSILYYVDSTYVYKYNFLSGKKIRLMDYSQPPYNFTLIVQSGYGDNSKDNWMAFVARNEHVLCALDLNTMKTYTTDFTLTQENMPYTGYKYKSGALISKGADAKSGKRYVMLQSADGPVGFFAVNLQTEALDFICRGPENPEYNPSYTGNYDCKCDSAEHCLSPGHPDLMEDPDGIQYLVFADDITEPCARTLVTLQLNTGVKMRLPVEMGGGMRKVMVMHQCGTSAWGDNHVGAAKSAPYFTISTEYAIYADTADHKTPLARGEHASEVITVKTISGGNYEVRRLIEHRSVEFWNNLDYAYWSEPRACMSNDGSRVICTSNFGTPWTGNGQQGLRTISIETGYNSTALGGSPVLLQENKIAIFPNPSDGVFQLAVDKSNAPLDLKILNIQGQLVYSELLPGKNEKYVREFDLRAMSKGVYLIKVASEDFVKTEKLIIQ